MATIQLTTDDLTGETLPEGNPTTRIVIDDPRALTAIEIDLSDDSVKALLKALSKYTSKGRELVMPEPKKATTPNTEAAKARAWAQSHRPDLQVADKGAVPTAALEAYREHVASLEGHASEDAINAAIVAGESSK